MKNSKFYILLILIVLLGGYNFYSNSNQPKIGVVDFQELVMEYDGMKEAMVLFEEKVEIWENQSDSLNQIMNAMVFDLESNQYSEEEIYLKESNLIQMRNYFIKFQEDVNIKAQEEDLKLTTSVLNQVMEFLDVFAVENGYDVIYGKNEGNFILYKSDEVNITEIVLNGLNKEYSGE